MQHHTLITVQLFVFSKQWKIGGEEDAQDTLYAAYTLDWYKAFPNRYGTFLGFQTFIKLTVFFSHRSQGLNLYFCYLYSTAEVN